MTTGTNANDTLTTSAAGDVLIGRGGDDLLQSDFDDTTLYGGVGDDTFETFLRAYPDRSRDLTRHSEHYGGSGNDSLSMISGFHWLSYDNFISTQSGGSGDDTIDGLATRLWAYGGSGNDLITQETYADEGSPFMHVDGGAGADTINAFLKGSDVVYGEAHIIGGGGADIINLEGRIEGSDATIEGGAGADKVDVNLSSIDGGNADAMVNAGGGADIVQVYTSGTDIGGSNVHVMGGAGADHITAQAIANWVQCTLEGGAGHDTLICTPNTRDGLVEAELYGDGGDDHLLASFRPGPIVLGRYQDVTVDLHLDGGNGHDLIEATIGQYNQSLSHPSAIFAAQIQAFGGLGHDTILISGGYDNMIDGGWGNDSIRGSDNADHILGGRGQDRIEGQSGDDILSGGIGKDTFVFAANDMGTRSITDWNKRQDRLDVDLVDLNGNGLLDELKASATYSIAGHDGHLVMGANNVIVFEDAAIRFGDKIENLFLDPLDQIL